MFPCTCTWEGNQRLASSLHGRPPSLSSTASCSIQLNNCLPPKTPFYDPRNRSNSSSLSPVKSNTSQPLSTIDRVRRKPIPCAPNLIPSKDCSTPSGLSGESRADAAVRRSSSSSSSSEAGVGFEKTSRRGESRGRAFVVRRGLRRGEPEPRRRAGEGGRGVVEGRGVATARAAADLVRSKIPDEWGERACRDAEGWIDCLRGESDRRCFFAGEPDEERRGDDDDEPFELGGVARPMRRGASMVTGGCAWSSSSDSSGSESLSSRTIGSETRARLPNESDSRLALVIRRGGGVGSSRSGDGEGGRTCFSGEVCMLEEG